jgi:hypothetical protein
MSEPDGHAATDDPVPFVAHLIAGAGGTPRVGLAYDYLMAGDGVFLATENPALALRAPPAPAGPAPGSRSRGRRRPRP